MPSLEVLGLHSGLAFDGPGVGGNDKIGNAEVPGALGRAI